MGGHKTMTIIAGLGFRRGCPANELVEIVGNAAARFDDPINALAVPDFKADEPGIQQAATALGLPLHRISRGAMEAVQDRCITRSDTARRAVGLASVAEAAALAAAGANGNLIVTCFTSTKATCALAWAP